MTLPSLWESNRHLLSLKVTKMEISFLGNSFLRKMALYARLALATPVRQTSMITHSTIEGKLVGKAGFKPAMITVTFIGQGMCFMLAYYHCILPTTKRIFPP